jgi:ABC-type nitrate/sulfonate/bicarbonate transport system substrate-binding protein
MRRPIQHFAAVALMCAAWVYPVTAMASETQLAVMVFQGVQNLPLLAAQARGFFGQRHLSIDLRFAGSSEEMRDGLARGHYQIVHGAVDNAVAMVESTHLDIAVIIGGDNGFNHLFVQSRIKSYQDLSGKTVIVDAPDTAYAFQLYAILKQHGVSLPEYEVRPVGASSKRLEAMLQDRSLMASMLNLPFTIRAQRAGLRDMGAAVDLLGPYQGTAGFVLRSWARANSDLLVSYIQAYVDGLRFVLDKSNRPAAIKMLTDELNLPADVAAQSYEIALDPEQGLARDAKFDLEGFENVLRLRAEFRHFGESLPPPQKYLDLGFYQRALAGL